MSLNDWFNLTLGEIPVRWVALLYLAWFTSRGVVAGIAAGVTEYRRIRREREDAARS